MPYRRGGPGGPGGRGGLGGLGGLGAVSLSSAGRRDRGKAARAYRKMRLESAGEQAAHVLPTPTPSLSSTDAPSLTPAHSHSEPMRPNSGRQSSVQAVIAIFDGRLSASAPPPSSRPSTVRVNVPPPPLSLKRLGLPSPPRSGSLSTLPVGVASGGEAPNNDVAAIDAGAAVPRRKITGSRRPSRPSGSDFTGNPCLQFLAQPSDSNITRRHSWPSQGVPQFPFDANPRPESCPPFDSPADPSSVGVVTTSLDGAKESYYTTAAAALAAKRVYQGAQGGRGGVAVATSPAAAVATYRTSTSVANYGVDITGHRSRLPTPPPSSTASTLFDGGAPAGKKVSHYESIDAVMAGERCTRAEQEAATQDWQLLQPMVAGIALQFVDGVVAAREEKGANGTVTLRHSGLKYRLLNARVVEFICQQGGGTTAYTTVLKEDLEVEKERQGEHFEDCGRKKLIESLLEDFRYVSIYHDKVQQVLNKQMAPEDLTQVFLNVPVAVGVLNASVRAFVIQEGPRQKLEIMRVLKDVMDSETPGNRSSLASLSSLDAFRAEWAVADPLSAMQRRLIDYFVELAQRKHEPIEPQFILDILDDLSSNTLYSVEHRTVFSDVKTSLKEKSLPSLISVQRDFLSLHESGTIKVGHL